MTTTTSGNQTITLDSEVDAVCTEKVDAGVSSMWNRFHLYFEQLEPLKTFCGIDLSHSITMISQGHQGKLRDAKVSCKRCNKTLQKLLSTLGDKR